MISLMRRWHVSHDRTIAVLYHLVICLMLASMVLNPSGYTANFRMTFMVLIGIIMVLNAIAASSDLTAKAELSRLATTDKVLTIIEAVLFWVLFVW